MNAIVFSECGDKWKVPQICCVTYVACRVSFVVCRVSHDFQRTHCVARVSDISIVLPMLMPMCDYDYAVCEYECGKTDVTTQRQRKQ